MAIPTVIGTVAFAQQSSSTTHTMAHTVPSSGTNRALIVITNPDLTNNDPTGVTYNAVPMSSIVNIAGTQRGHYQMWYLANPSTGNNNVVATYASAQVGNLSAITLQDCAQSSPVDVSGHASGGSSSTSLSKSITTTLSSNLLIAWLGTNASTSGFVDNGSQTRQVTLPASPNNNTITVSTLPLPNPGSQSMGYTWTTTSNADIWVVAIESSFPDFSVSISDSSVVSDIVIINPLFISNNISDISVVSDTPSLTILGDFSISKNEINVVSDSLSISIPTLPATLQIVLNGTNGIGFVPGIKIVS